MKKLAVPVVAAALTMTLAAWGTTTNKPASTSSHKKETVDFIFTGYMYPYFAPMAQAVKEAAKYYPNLSIKIIAANNSGSEESAEISEAVASGVDGIILNPVDGAVTSAAEQAMSQKVPVITIDRDVDSTAGRIAFIGDNDVKLGEIQTNYALKYMAEKHIPTPWNVAILQGTLGSSTAINRLQGEMNALKPYIKDHKVKIVLNQSANFATNTAQQVMSEFLAKDSHVNLVLTGNDAMALGAITAIQAEHLPLGKSLFVASADAQPQDLQDIRRGTQLDDVTHSPFVEAYWAVEAMANYLDYHIKPPAHFKDGDIIIPMTLVTKANVSQIHAWGTPNVIPPLPYGKSSAHHVTP